MTKINWQEFEKHLGRISEILKKIDFNDLEQADILMNEIESVTIKRNNSLKKNRRKTLGGGIFIKKRNRIIDGIL